MKIKRNVNLTKFSHLAFLTILGIMLAGCNKSQQIIEPETETEEATEIIFETEIETETEEPGILEKYGEEPLELDWDALVEENEHIYAWIYVPKTSISYPILQHPTKTDYYLEYNIDHTKGRPGCIYTQNMNAKDFSDNNTVIYGHNMRNGTMFRTLHNFDDGTFFDETPYFYIYTPEKILVYEIFAASEFSNEHILYKYDFDAEGTISKFMSDLKKCPGHIREEMQTIPENGPLVTLSTCVTGKTNNRWLVVGVLLSEEPLPTKDE